MLAKDLKPGVELGPTMKVATVERDGDIVRVRYESGGMAEYHADEDLGADA